MRVSIYDVQHGFSAFIRTPNDKIVLIDAGHSANGWTPSIQLLREGYRFIDRQVVSNFDQDHMDDLVGLLQFSPQEYVVNLSVPPGGLALEKLQNGRITADTAAVIKLLRNLQSGHAAPPKDWGGVEFAHFCNAFPRDFGIDRLNDLSVITFAHYGNIHIVFPGDLEAAGWRRLLEVPWFVAHLSRVNIFVASHHGRADGRCEDVFKICTPIIVIFSDSEVAFDSQKTASWYADRASGMLLNGTMRYVLTTRKDRAIHIDWRPGIGGWVWTEAPLINQAA